MIEAVKLALTAILANKFRSFLTTLGIVIGVLSVVLLISLVSGLQTYINKQFTDLGSNLIFVMPGKIGGNSHPGEQVNRLTLTISDDLKEKLKDSAGVSALVQRTSTIKYLNKSVKNSTIVGAQGNFYKVFQSYKVKTGRFFTNNEAESGKRVIVVGATVAKDLFSSKDPIGQSINVGDLKYRIIGILETRGSNFGIDQDNAAIIPLNTAVRQFGFQNINGIYISANSSGQVRQVQDKAKTILLKHLSGDDFTIQTSDQTLQTISQITGILTAALGGIAAISLLVGGIGIMNIMLVSVTERTREIGLRKAVGARPSDIRNQFLMEAIVLSGLGGIIGIVLGVGIAAIIGRFFTTTVPWWSVVLSFGFSMTVGVVFGVAPAMRAAKLDPIASLRYE